MICLLAHEAVQLEACRAVCELHTACLLCWHLQVPCSPACQPHQVASVLLLKSRKAVILVSPAPSLPPGLPAVQQQGSKLGVGCRIFKG